MPELGSSRIVNSASVHGLVASAYKAACAAAKDGLVGLTKTVALEAGDVPPPLDEARLEASAAAYGTTAEAVVAGLRVERNAVRRLIEPERGTEFPHYIPRPGAWTTTGAAIPMDARWLTY